MEEQFDTDEKLINSKKKKESTISCAQLLLLGVTCLLSLCALYYLFKYVKTPETPKNHLFDISK